MNSIKKIHLFILPFFMLLMYSCSTTDKVVSDSFISKRKYNKGFFLNKKSNKIKHIDSNNDVLVFSDKKLDIKSDGLINDDDLVASVGQNQFIPINNNIDEELTFNIESENRQLVTKLSSNKLTKIQNRINKKQLKVNKSKKQISDDSDPKLHWAALTGFICSIVGLIVFPILLGLLGIIFSSIGLSKINKDNFKGKGFAIAGLVVGIIDVVLIFLIVALILGGVLL